MRTRRSGAPEGRGGRRTGIVALEQSASIIGSFSRGHWREKVASPLHVKLLLHCLKLGIWRGTRHFWLGISLGESSA